VAELLRRALEKLKITSDAARGAAGMNQR